MRFTAKLERLHRSDFPIAVRNTLNSAAFDVKKITMPQSAKQNFTERNKTFFKANSKVIMAQGFAVNSMKSQAGFFSNNLKGGNNFAVKDLEQQEKGGKIKGKSFIPLEGARGGNKSRPVRPVNRLSKVTKVVNANSLRGKGRFIKAAIKAGKGNHVIAFDTLYKVSSIRKLKGRTKVNAKAMYSFKKGRSVKVKATGFMQEATVKTISKIDDFYIKEAKKRFEKRLR